MAKSKKLDRKSDSHNHLISLHKLSSRCTKVCGHDEKKSSAKTEWEDAECSVCLEFPHNAVLLLCSSYDKGCRPYMCATSHRYSNCLDQYTKATTNKTSRSWQMSSGISCPLCRGQVKGWTVVEPARSYLNAKKRPCVQEGCSFVGQYKELRKHVRSKHPLARPRDVDPLHAKKWQKLENERDLSDVLSTIRSSMPGAIVIGDYVIDYGSSSSDDDDMDMDMVGSFYGASSYTRAGQVVERQNPPQQRVGLVVSHRAARRSSETR